MKATIINIGDELLIGQVINSNASWIAQQLNTIGIDVLRINIVSDKADDIFNVLDEAKIKADIILMTGGLGPTNDDITKETLCKYFNTCLVLNESVIHEISEIFKKRGLTLTEKNRKQAEVPESCTVIPNKQGTAPGMWFEQNEKIFISMPGVPYEMKAMISDFIIPMLKEKTGKDAIVHKTILTQGIGESFLSDIIEDWENNLPKDVNLAYLPSPGLVRLRLTAKGIDYDVLSNIIENEITKLKKLIPEYIYGFDSEALELIIGKLLTERGKTLVTAESCTGGYIAHCITKVPGSSVYFKGSIIAYSNEVKENLLNVKHETLVEHGAVSEETVKEMAKNIRLKLNANFSIAVSGIAGPDGGTPEKPVGLVYIAVASKDSVLVEKFQFWNNRLANIERATVNALNMLRKEIIKKA